MKANVGGADRVIRILLGIGLILYAIFGLKGSTQYIVGVIGLIPLLTGLFRYCPLYRLFGWSTCPLQQEP